MKLFFVHSRKEVVTQSLALVFWAILAAVFFAFKKYTPGFVVCALFIVFLVELFNVIIVSSESIRWFSWGKIKVDIPVEEIEELDTKAGDIEKLVIYGSRDLITCAYKPVLFKTILDKLEIEGDKSVSLLEEDEDFTQASGTWTLIRENVLLDKLFKKEKYTHRRVIDYEKRDLSRQLSHDEGK